MTTLFIAALLGQLTIGVFDVDASWRGCNSTSAESPIGGTVRLTLGRPSPGRLVRVWWMEFGGVNTRTPAAPVTVKFTSTNLNGYVAWVGGSSISSPAFFDPRAMKPSKRFAAPIIASVAGTAVTFTAIGQSDVRLHASACWDVTQ